MEIRYSNEIFVTDNKKNIRGDIARDLCKKIVFDLGSPSIIVENINQAISFYVPKDNSLSIDKIMRKAGCLK